MNGYPNRDTTMRYEIGAPDLEVTGAIDPSDVNTKYDAITGKIDFYDTA
jgi:hypothetical protein